MMRTYRTTLSAILIPLLTGGAAIAGCSDDDPSPAGTSAGAGGGGLQGNGGAGAGGGDGGSGGDGGAEPGLTIVWSPCPLATGTSGAEAECADIEVPAKWDDPAAGTITIFVKRLLATQQPSRGQAWFLQGGPGYSGADFEPLAGNIHAVTQDIDVYMPDHRGVGRSSRLSCAGAEDAASDGGAAITAAEMPSCIAGLVADWGPRLDGFSMTNAARDLGELVTATRADGQDVIVYGGSYGSDWGNRYLQIYPDQPTAVILDAVAVNGRLSDIDVWFNDLGQRWMALCAGDAFCSSKLGPDPWATMTQALADLDQGACPEVAALGVDRRYLQSIWAYFFYSWDLRGLVAPMVYRLDRCSQADINAYTALAFALSQPPPDDPTAGLFSVLLSMHVALSELWESPPPSLQELEAFRDQANLAHGLATQFAKFHDAWPRYPLDAYARGLGMTEAPMLLLHGEYDFIPLAVVEPTADHYSGVGKTFVNMPRAPHGTFQSPSADYPSCGGHLLREFLEGRTTPLDTSCAPTVEVVSFDIDPGLSNSAFQTPDAWEGDPGPQAFPAIAPSLAKALGPRYRELQQVVRWRR